MSQRTITTVIPRILEAKPPIRRLLGCCNDESAPLPETPLDADADDVLGNVVVTVETAVIIPMVPRLIKFRLSLCLSIINSSCSK